MGASLDAVARAAGLSTEFVTELEQGHKDDLRVSEALALAAALGVSVERLVGTVGVSVEGVDFNSLDGDKVNLLFLLVSPPDRPGDHLRALENISRQLRDDTFCRFLKQARSAHDIRLLLEEADNNQFVS